MYIKTPRFASALQLHQAEWRKTKRTRSEATKRRRTCIVWSRRICPIMLQGRRIRLNGRVSECELNAIRLQCNGWGVNVPMGMPHNLRERRLSARHSRVISKVAAMSKYSKDVPEESLVHMGYSLWRWPSLDRVQGGATDGQSPSLPCRVDLLTSNVG